MAAVKVASFNVWGIDGKKIDPALGVCQSWVGPSDADLVAIGFQEVWFQHQLDAIQDRWVPGASSVTRFVDADCRFSSRSEWKCLVPRVGGAGLPGLKHFELGSGLALCVRGRVRDAFFVRFRGGYVPDSFAKKGMLAARVIPPGRGARAIVNTHFHDFSNDAFGGARRNHLEQLASTLKWIETNWRVPIVLIGDFNIDSRAAYTTRQPTIETVLYRKLASIAKRAGAWWHDVNAHANQFKPVPTQASQNGAIDLHLLSDAANKAGLRFDSLVVAQQTKPPFSDHRLTVSSWSEA